MGSFLGGNIKLVLLHQNEIAHLSQLSFLAFSYIDSFYLIDKFLFIQNFLTSFLIFSKLGRKKKDEDDSEQAMDKEG